MENYNPLNVVMILPLIFFAFAWVMPKAVVRLYSIFGAFVIFAMTVYQCSGLIFTNTAMAANTQILEDKFSWLPELGVYLTLRLDTTSVWFVLISALTTVVAFSLRGPWYRKHPRLFSALGFFLVFALNTAFLTTDLVVFYLAYEAVFIPMIFMVGIWGENQKATSLFRFFLMSFFGSILMLVSILYLMSVYHSETGTWSSQLSDLIQLSHSRSADSLCYAFIGFFLAFAIKVPLVPFHGWLKDVYVNAPMPTTIWLSAALSKLGVFGMLRFVLPIFGNVSTEAQGWLLLLATLSVLYPAFLAIRANNPKELLAYSSISHLGFVMLGVFSMRGAGGTTAILLSIGHALESSILFFLYHHVEERREGLKLNTAHGLAARYPTLFVAMFLTVLASVSLPGTLNFNGEFLVLLNAYPVSALCAILSGLGVIFGALYMLRFFQQLGLSKKVEIAHNASVAKDLSGYDLAIFLFVFALIIYGGVQPAIFLKGN